MVLRSGHLVGCVVLLAGACGERRERPAPEAGESAVVAENPWDAPLARPEPGDAAQATRLLEEAVQLHRARRDEEALVRFEEAVEADPSHLSTRLEYGEFLLDSLSQKSDRRALLMFRTARLFEPEQPRAILGEALARSSIGDFRTAEPLLQEALALPLVQGDPDLRSKVQHAIGLVRHAEGEAERAREHYEEALRLAREPRGKTTALLELAMLDF